MPLPEGNAMYLEEAEAQGFRLREETPLEGLGLRMLSLDIPPPLGKIILMIASALGGYDGVTVGWEKIGVDIPSSVNLLALRGAPALQGALLVPLMFSTARALGLSTPASLVVACGVLLDGCFLVESRLVLTDATLLLCLVLQIWGCAAAAVCASRGLQPQDSQRSLRTPTSGPRVGAGAPAALEAVDAALRRESASLPPRL